MATDLFKTPEQLFKKYLLSNAIQLTQTNFEPFNEIEQRSENEVTEYTLDVGLSLPALMSSTSESFNAQLKLTTDIPNKNEELELNINKGEEEFFKGYIALTDETLGLKVPDLHDKYLAVENRDLKKIAKTFSLPQEYVDMIPDKIPSAMSEEEKAKIEAISTKFVTKLTEQFDENSYIAEKNIQVNINSKDVVADRYSITMSTKAMYTSITTFLKELFDDPDFVALCQDRVSTEQLESLRTAYDKLLEKNPSNEIEDKIIKLSVYASDGKTVKTELTMDENEASVIIENNETESMILLSVIEPKTENSQVGSTTTTTFKNTFVDNSGEFSYETKTEYNKDDIKALQDEYDSKMSNNNFDFSSYTMNYSEMYEDTEQKYIIKTTKSNDSTITGKIQFDGTGIASLTDLLDISFKCKFGSATVNTIDESNAIILNDYTMADYQKLLTELGTNLAATAIKKPDSLIGTLLANSADNLFNTGDNGDNTSEDENNTSEDIFTNIDETNSEESAENYNDITLPDDSSNDNYLYPTISNNTEIVKSEIDNAITNGLTDCLEAYKADFENNPEADLGIYLTVENVQLYCGDRYTLELLDSTTIKCTINEDQTVYYAIMNIDGYELVVTDVEVLTEEEYLNR